jgi:hypothetical protein
MHRAELPPFDLILGTDLLYEQLQHDALAETMTALSKPGTVALLCTPDGRADDRHHPFFSRMRMSGWWDFPHGTSFYQLTGLSMPHNLELTFVGVGWRRA